MLTAKNISAARASDYFLKGHLQKGESRWHGQGAKVLGLSGEVNNKKKFNNICDGFSPEANKKLCGRTLDPISRRAATDFTFSAPKSVSLMALVADNKQIIKAHQTAVEKTLDLIEQRYASTRVTINGERKIVTTGNLVVAEFDHIESRELDPHLHTHALVMNMTQTPSGQWYSNFNDQIFANKKFLGMYYQSNLGQEVQKLGYKIQLLPHGQFEIAGFESQQLEEFSQRKQQILAQLGQHYTREEKEKIWESTRKPKEDINPQLLKANWKQRACELRIIFPKPIRSSNIVTPQINQKDIDKAISDCSEKKTIFNQEDLEKSILINNPLKNISQVPKLIKSNNSLIYLSTQQSHHFSTEAAVQQELTAIRLMLSGQNKVKPIRSQKSYYRQEHLTQDQKHALLATINTKNQFIAWQDIPSKRKISSLIELKHLINQAGYQTKAFIPDSKAKEELSQNLNIPVHAISSLKTFHNKSSNNPKQFWIVSDAHFLNTSNIINLFKKAIKEKARVLLLGNARKVSQISFTDNIFKSLKQAGLQTIHLNQSSKHQTKKTTGYSTIQSQINNLEAILKTKPDTSQSPTTSKQSPTTSKRSTESLTQTKNNSEFLKSKAKEIEQLITIALNKIGAFEEDKQVFITKSYVFKKQGNTISVQDKNGTEVLKNNKFTPSASKEDLEKLQEFANLAQEYLEESYQKNIRRGIRL